MSRGRMALATPAAPECFKVWLKLDFSSIQCWPPTCRCGEQLCRLFTGWSSQADQKQKNYSLQIIHLVCKTGTHTTPEEAAVGENESSAIRTSVIEGYLYIFYWKIQFPTDTWIRFQQQLFVFSAQLCNLLSLQAELSALCTCNFPLFLNGLESTVCDQ